jgi:hypothetical protein
MQTATQFNVSDKLTLVSVTQEDETTSTEYKCNVAVQLAGDSIWDCAITDVVITSINIHETFWNEDEDCEVDSCIYINVCYTVDGSDEVEGSWRLYTDTGFSDAISALLGTGVMFTEQGMQENNVASMEL